MNPRRTSFGLAPSVIVLAAWAVAATPSQAEGNCNYAPRAFCRGLSDEDEDHVRVFYNSVLNAVNNHAEYFSGRGAGGAIFHRGSLNDLIAIRLSHDAGGWTVVLRQYAKRKIWTIVDDAARSSSTLESLARNSIPLGKSDTLNSLAAIYPRVVDQIETTYTDQPLHERDCPAIASLAPELQQLNVAYAAEPSEPASDIVVPEDTLIIPEAGSIEVFAGRSVREKDGLKSSVDRQSAGGYVDWAGRALKAFRDCQLVHR